jgi:MOSC domain-containing protein YiiM
MSAGTVTKLCRSKAKGTPKEPVPSARFISNFGIEQDAHASSESHRQVSLLATETIQVVKDRGVDVGPGAFGENLCISGVSLASVKVGDVFEVGDGVRLEITQIGKECHTRCSIYYRAGLCIMPTDGLFARVISGGEVKEGDPIRLISGP